MGNRISLLLGMDAGFAPYYGVMLTSLLENNRSHFFDVYVLTDSSWSERLTWKYTRLLEKYYSNLFVYKVDESLISTCPLNPESHISRPTYYRLMAPSLLPLSVSRVLYLDGDMIVNGDISELWNTDIDRYAFAGVEDWAFILPDNYTRLQYDNEYGYYNAGVTLYNLDFWRKNKVSDRIFDYINNNVDRIKWLDQDAVNGLLHSDRCVLPIKYNFQVFFFMRETWKQYSESLKSEIIKASEDPVIVHYNGHIKPWDYHYCGYPYYRLWKKFAKKSPWLFVSKHKPYREYLKFLAKCVLYKDKVLWQRNNDLVEQAYELE